MNTSFIRSSILVGFIGLAAAAWYFVRSTTPMPSVNLVTVQGEKISTDALKGKVALVNFWATSCTTCVAEMPNMVQTYQKFAPRGYEMLAVAMSYDPPNYVLNFAQTRALPFKVALDIDGQAAAQFGKVQLTPTSFLINKQGQIIKRYVGAPDFAELEKLIEQNLS